MAVEAFARQKRQESMLWTQHGERRRRIKIFEYYISDIM